MTNTHSSLIGRGALLGLLALPAASATAAAQFRIEDRDRGDRRAIEIARETARRAEDVRRSRDAERRLFTWRGSVDDDTRIYVRSGRVVDVVRSGASPRRKARVDHDRPLPRRDGLVRVELIEGRGRAHVVQQPDARNDWTAIVRVKDAARGADVYRFATYFDPDEEWSRGRDDDDDYYDRDGVRRAEHLRSGDRVLRWSGQVDHDLEIRIRPDGLWHDVASGQRPRDVSATGVRALPRRDGYLQLVNRQARGLVYVVQQPSRVNDYTAIIRVRDAQAGYGWYDFDVIWR